MIGGTEHVVVLVAGVDSGPVGQWIVLVLAGGGALGIYTLVKAFLAVRGSVEMRESKAIQNLEKWRIEADERADRAETRLATAISDVLLERAYTHYWELRAANAERELALNGVPIPLSPPQPMPRPDQWRAHPESSGPGGTLGRTD